jgi:hypothetical protein
LTRGILELHAYPSGVDVVSSKLTRIDLLLHLSVEVLANTDITNL